MYMLLCFTSGPVWLCACLILSLLASAASTTDNSTEEIVTSSSTQHRSTSSKATTTVVTSSLVPVTQTSMGSITPSPMPATSPPISSTTEHAKATNNTERSTTSPVAVPLQGSSTDFSTVTSSDSNNSSNTIGSGTVATVITSSAGSKDDPDNPSSTSSSTSSSSSGTSSSSSSSNSTHTYNTITDNSSKTSGTDSHNATTTPLLGTTQSPDSSPPSTSPLVYTTQPPDRQNNSVMPIAHTTQPPDTQVEITSTGTTKSRKSTASSGSIATSSFLVTSFPPSTTNAWHSTHRSTPLRTSTPQTEANTAGTTSAQQAVTPSPVANSSSFHSSTATITTAHDDVITSDSDVITTTNDTTTNYSDVITSNVTSLYTDNVTTTVQVDSTDSGAGPSRGSGVSAGTVAIIIIVFVIAMVTGTVMTCVYRSRRTYVAPRVSCMRHQNSLSARLSASFLWNGGGGGGGSGANGQTADGVDMQYTVRKNSLRKIRVPSRVPRKTSSSPSCTLATQSRAAGGGGGSSLRNSVSLGSRHNQRQQSALSVVNPCFEDPVAPQQYRDCDYAESLADPSVFHGAVSSSLPGMLGDMPLEMIGSQVINMEYADQPPTKCSQAEADTNVDADTTVSVSQSLQHKGLSASAIEITGHEKTVVRSARDASVEENKDTATKDKQP
ncbi:uncharacterized protein LOC135827430 [Sycon ciliatum]|uniref:uncharacterized protein LOC135827430 n=1 Tax=Sycon ciliatum TaxID=27933 RepID=UPI0031F6AEEA